MSKNKKIEVPEYIMEYYSTVLPMLVDIVLKDREIMLMREDGKVVRMSEYEMGDLHLLIEEGFIEIHMTAEKWREPLQTGVEYKEEEYAEKMKSCDLIIDFDIEGQHTLYAAKYLVKKTLDVLSKFLGDPNLPLVKFSGRRGFHIILPNFISDYLKEYSEFYPFVRKEIHLAVLKLIQYLLKKDILKLERYGYKVEIDTKLATYRHMIRAPMSLHSKTRNISIPIIQPYENILKFDVKQARISTVIDKLEEYEAELYKLEFIPKENYSELVYNALVFYMKEALHDIFNRREVRLNLDKQTINKLEDLMPPCIKRMWQGVPEGVRTLSRFNLTVWMKKIPIPKNIVYSVIQDKNIPYEQAKKLFIREMIYQFNERCEPPEKEKRVEYDLDYLLNRRDYGLSCETIRKMVLEQLGEQHLCDQCPFKGIVKSPIGATFKLLKALKNKEK